MTKVICEAKVIAQKFLAPDVKLIEVKAPEIASQGQPGQFVNVEVSRQAAPLLRRPLGLAVVNKEAGTCSMIYRIIGEGTHLLADTCVGATLSIIGPLGHGFDLNAKRPLVVGGGLGLAPLLNLVTSLAVPVDILIGGRTKAEVFWTELFREHVRNVYVTTDDGSCGTQGNVNALLPQLLAEGEYDCVYVCGPVPMMKAVAQVVEQAGLPCQVSLEKYMACGLGACLSCTCDGIGKRLKVCTDGPVFWSKEVAEW